jgi:putative intracellular protease/amidase
MRRWLSLGSDSADGGWGTRTEINNQRLVGWIGARGRAVETLTSVCTGSMLLGQAKLLDGRRATTHWRALPWMRESFPAVTVEEKLHVVEDCAQSHGARYKGRLVGTIGHIAAFSTMFGKHHCTGGHCVLSSQLSRTNRQV